MFYKYKVMDLYYEGADSTTHAFFNFLQKQRGHSLYLSFEEDYDIANYNFSSFIDNTSAPFVSLLETYNSTLDDMLSFTHSQSTEADETGFVENTSEAAVDSTLNKENDTPTGVNIDLTDDLFITRSERTVLNTGEREQYSLNEKLSNANVIYRDDMRKLQVLKDIGYLVKAIYLDWMRFVERELLTFDFNNFD